MQMNDGGLKKHDDDDDKEDNQEILDTISSMNST